jgi:hypothetical protein
MAAFRLMGQKHGLVGPGKAAGPGLGRWVCASGPQIDERSHAGLRSLAVQRKALKVSLALVATVAIAAPLFAIVGGEPDTGEEYPNVGAIIATDHPVLPTPQTVSTATLIHKKVVMTAGHTVQFIRDLVENNPAIDLDDFAVVFTADAHDGTGTEYRIAETRIHEGFTDFDPKAARDATSIDVGLLILEEAVQGITPVQLPTKGFLDGLDLDRGPSETRSKFILVGYGTTAVPKTTAELPPGERRVAISGFKSLRDRYLMLSQQFSLGEGGLSRGDSGAPAFWESSDGSLVQVAVANNGDHASVSYGACVRTDLETVIDFIQDAIDDAGE